jgi:hypothetical protein
LVRQLGGKAACPPSQRRGSTNLFRSSPLIEFRFALEMFPQFLFRVGDFCRHNNSYDDEDVSVKVSALTDNVTGIVIRNSPVLEK